MSKSSSLPEIAASCAESLNLKVSLAKMVLRSVHAMYRKSVSRPICWCQRGRGMGQGDVTHLLENGIDLLLLCVSHCEEQEGERMKEEN